MKSISEIDKYLCVMKIKELKAALDEYRNDQRIGVQKLVKKYNNKIIKYEKEILKFKTMLEYENEYYSCGYTYIAGIDEVGRGPLAGPVVSVAVILPKDCLIRGVDDSKKLSEKKRLELFDKISEKAVSIGIGIIDVETIDNKNILQATYLSMKKAIAKLHVKPEVILVDAVTIPALDILQKPIIKGDSKSVSIASASIIAKVTRDNMMKNFDKIYPEYYFKKNKGYGTQEHIDAIKKYGLSPIHRKSFTSNILR